MNYDLTAQSQLPTSDSQQQQQQQQPQQQQQQQPQQQQSTLPNIPPTHFLDFDYTECDIFNITNHHHNTSIINNNGTLHGQQSQQQQQPNQSTFLLDGMNPTQSYVIAPKKFEYLGQKEEQIFLDQKNTNILGLGDFDLGQFNPATSTFSLSTDNTRARKGSFTFNITAQEPSQQSQQTQQQQQQAQQSQQFIPSHDQNNQQNNTNLAHNANPANNNTTSLLLNFNQNPNYTVDIADLFPSEQVQAPKQPDTQPQLLAQINQQQQNSSFFEPTNTYMAAQRNNIPQIANQRPTDFFLPPLNQQNMNHQQFQQQTSQLQQQQPQFGQDFFQQLSAPQSQQQLFQIFSTIPMQQPGQSMQSQNYFVNRHQESFPFNGTSVPTQAPIQDNLNRNNYQSLFNENVDARSFVPLKQQQCMSSFAMESQAQQRKPASQGIFSIVRDKQNGRKKDYDKNICRYITRQVIRSFASSEFKSQVLSLIADRFSSYSSAVVLALYKDATDYFVGEIENISGFRALRDILVVNEATPTGGIADTEELATYKRIFHDFMRWFLKERYVRNILSGNMTDKLAFIRYKNKIMLHYIDKPQKWNSNKKKRASNGSNNRDSLRNASSLFSNKIEMD